QREQLRCFSACSAAYPATIEPTDEILDTTSIPYNSPRQQLNPTGRTVRAIRSCIVSFMDSVSSTRLSLRHPVSAAEPVTRALSDTRSRPVGPTPSWYAACTAADEEKQEGEYQ